MSFAQHNSVISTFSAERADDAFSVRILPWRRRRGDHMSQSDRIDSPYEKSAEFDVSVPDQVPIRTVVSNSFKYLLSDPSFVGIRRGICMKYLSSVMAKDDCYEQYAKGRSRDRKEIEGHQFL